MPSPSSASTRSTSTARPPPDTVIAACRDAGFEPRLDEQAAGSTVWGDIARGRGVGLVVGSLRHQLPRGLTLLALAPPAPTLAIDLVWPVERTTAAIRRLLDVADRLAENRGWLPRLRSRDRAHPTALHTAPTP